MIAADPLVMPETFVTPASAIPAFWFETPAPSPLIRAEPCQPTLVTPASTIPAFWIAPPSTVETAGALASRSRSTSCAPATVAKTNSAASSIGSNGRVALRW